jgi:hypothetical protein
MHALPLGGPAFHPEDPSMSYRPPSAVAPLACLLAVSLCLCARAADVRVGDAGCKPDPARFDDNYPDMKEWASAGVRGGVPDRADGKIFKTLKPGDDIQGAIDTAAKAGGGVVLLSDGTYPLDKTILLRSGVVLRGQDKEGVVLQCEIKSSEPAKKLATVRLTDTKRAGLEDLTIQNGIVALLGLNVYHEKFAGPKDDAQGNNNLHVSGVVLERAEDCWVDNCSILHSGSHPFNGQGSHVTVRDTLIDGAFNKGDGTDPAGSGNVYFIFNNGLMYNCTVKNVRHALVMRDSLSGEPCKYNVILDCNFEGDVDFHANRKDDGHNLFEGTLVHAPAYHGWCAWSYWKKAEIGPENLVYKSLGWGGPTGPGGAGAKDKFGSTDPDKVYTYTGVHDPNVLPALDKPAPKSGTLYAITAARPNRPDAYGAWPKTPAEALRLIDQRMIKSPLTLTAGK